MRNVIFAGAIAVATVSFGSSVNAADLGRAVYKAAPAPVAMYSWTGFYVGGHAGYAWDVDASSSLAPANAATEAFAGPSIASGAIPSSYSVGGNGWLGGFQGGYNWQANNVVFGIEADFSWTNDLGGSVNIPTIALFPVNSFSSDVEWFGTVRGRLGLLTTPNMLIYGTGGFAFAKVNQSTLVSPLNGDVFAGSSSGHATGWTVGGGLEYALGNNWSIKGEYLFVHLDPKNYTTSAFGGGCTATNCLVNVDTADIEMQIVRAGLNYKF